MSEYLFEGILSFEPKHSIFLHVLAHFFERNNSVFIINSVFFFVEVSYHIDPVDIDWFYIAYFHYLKNKFVTCCLTMVRIFHREEWHFSFHYQIAPRNYFLFQKILILLRSRVLFFPRCYKLYYY